MSGYDFSLNPRPLASLRQMGRDGEPLLQIDGLMRDTAQLAAYAAAEVEYVPVYGPGGGYPGIRGPAPLDYVEATVRALSPLLIEAFGLGRVKLARAECNFSLVTLPPEALAPAQRVPHIDTNEPLQFAFLHYLCGPEHGGTAFYRHRATGFEAITAERHAAYEAARAGEGEPPAGYIGAQSPHFEAIAASEAAFGRMLIYRSRVLHSGQVDPARLTPDPRRGRLTANIFLNYRPL